MGPRIDMGCDEFFNSSPVLSLAPDDVRFNAKLDGPNPECQTLYICNTGEGTINWKVIHDCSWLTVIPPSGNSTDEIDEAKLYVTIGGLEPNLYNCAVSIGSEEAVNGYQTISVSLTVQGPVIRFSTNQLSFEAIQNGEDPPVI